ncbi:MAG: hypothetical protein J1F11_01700 [Oscillospiraceae bacterium]|nr:hypothetical protein [Oscillospiraceae bacterium]
MPKKVDGEVVSKAKVDELKGSPILKTITKDQAGEYTYSSTSSETTQDVQVGGVSAVGAGKFVIDATSDIPASLNDKTFTWKVNKATVDVVDVKVVTPTDFDKWEGTGVDKEFVYGVSASACASVSNATVAATLGATADIDAIAALDEDGDGVITFSTTDTGANWKADNTAQTSYAVAALKTLLGDSTIAASNTNASFTVTLTYAWLDATTKAASDPADIDVLVVSQAPITYGATITAHPATAAPEADGTYSWPGNVTYPATIALAEAVGLTDGTKITIKANTTTTNGSWTKVANGVTTPNATLPDFIYNMTKEDFTDGDKIIITAATVDESDLKGYTSKIAGLATGYTGGSFRRYPYMSNLNTSGVMSLSYGWTTYYNYNATDRFNLYANGGDIITYLEGQAVNSGATATNKDWFKNNKQLSGNFGSYTNVGAVLNDAVQNYDVTFTFNTATQGVNVCYYDASTPTWGATADWNNNMYGMYDSDTWKAWVSTEYMAFGQHLYPLYDFELSQFVGMDWAGVNLFAGALVINGGLTMSLSNTEYFDWTKTSISFSWDDIVDAAAEKGITNDYALTIQTMGLVTSQTWFWDSMDVVLAVRSEDDASADAGIDSDDDVIEDEDIDEGDDIDVEPEDVEPEPEPEPEPEAAPVEATSPKTGNASVALAVIPVALAAAAVVAKKRG